MYKLADLESAKAELSAVEARWESYNGNNPNKYHSQRNEAKVRVQIIEDNLKASGEISLSDQEILVRDLDSIFPNATSKEVVQHQGVRYQRRFTPAASSRSGNVTRWCKSWVTIP